MSTPRTKTAQPLLTPRQVAAQIGMSYGAVLDYIAAGELPAHDLKRSTSRRSEYRIRQSDLDRWINSRQVVT